MVDIPNPRSYDVLTAFHLDTFQKRLGEVASHADMYNGALEAAYDSSQDLTPVVIGGGAVPKLGTFVDNELDGLTRKIRNSGVSSITIEAAHVYANDDLSNPVVVANLEQQAIHAAAIRARLQEADIKTTELLFVDDYNVPEGQAILDIDQLREILAKSGFNPSILFKEADMDPLARNVIDFMDQEQGLVKRKTAGGTGETEGRIGDGIHDYFLTYRGAELYRQSDNKVTCAMLDAALTLIKVHHVADGVLNILPKAPLNAENATFSYKGQQEKMRMIIGEHLRVRATPIFNIYTKGTDQYESTAGAHHTLRKPRRQ